MDKQYRIRFAIKYTNAAVNGICPVCRGHTDPSIPLALFLDDTYQDVCDQCGNEHAPELMVLLKYFYKHERALYWDRPDSGDPVQDEENSGPVPDDSELQPF